MLTLEKRSLKTVMQKSYLTSKEEQSKPKASKRKKIIWIKSEINETESNNNNQWNQTLVIWKPKKIDKSLSRVTKRRKRGDRNYR